MILSRVRNSKAVRVSEALGYKSPCFSFTPFSFRPRVKLFLRGEIRYN